MTTEEAPRKKNMTVGALAHLTSYVAGGRKENACVQIIDNRMFKAISSDTNCYLSADEADALAASLMDSAAKVREIHQSAKGTA
jgi:hypothetical protein